MTTAQVIAQLEKESEQQRQAKLLKPLLQSLAGLHGFALLYTLFVAGLLLVAFRQGEHVKTKEAILYLTGKQVMLAVWALLYLEAYSLNRRGKTRLAAQLMCWLLTIESFLYLAANLIETTSTSADLTPLQIELASAVIMSVIMMLTVLLSGMVIGRRAILPFVAVDTVLISSIFLLTLGTESLGLIVPLVCFLAVIGVVAWLNQKTVDEANRALLRVQLEKEAELEQRIADRTAQLETANKELEAFSYSVSHDLRAPLRAIDGFSRILLEDYAPQLLPEVARYLRIIFESTQHMGRLIDGLLAFSRLSRQPLNKQPIVSAELVRQALDGLSDEQAGRRVEISMGELLPCQGDPLLLKQVWVNLLSNALKFTRQREMARIEIGCQTNADGEQVYFVKDNGVGFDMQYADKLFGVFQRLHRTEEYEGTGVGLAIVQRIVHRHGGRAWAEAAPGEGATFYFTLR
jgi:signal transduction histidine kinase